MPKSTASPTAAAGNKIKIHRSHEHVYLKELGNDNIRLIGRAESPNLPGVWKHRHGNSRSFGDSGFLNLKREDARNERERRLVA